MDIVLLGIQGSGKGTQSKFLVERYGLEYFETGSILRKMAQDPSELGQKVKSIIEAGHLVSTEIVMEIIGDFMKKLPAGKNVLFDGIPRKPDQEEAFNAVMEKSNRAFRCVYIALSKEEAMSRLVSRRICEPCKAVYPASYQTLTCEKCGGKLITRSDDNPQAIENRLNAFFNETTPVINDYRAKNLLIEIDGTSSIEHVTQALFAKLDPILA